MQGKLVLCVALSMAIAGSATATDLKPKTLDAFDRYVVETESRITREQSASQSFLAIDSMPGAQRAQAEARLRRGEVVIQSRNKTAVKVPDGLIHHWTGTAFIPGAVLAQLMAVVQDYDHLERYYSPEVARSKMLSRSGDNFRISMRVRKKKVVTIVMDTDYDVHYGRLDPAHYFSTSRSTRVLEIANPGEPSEHPLPEGQDHGFLWRLNSYWRFVQVRDGVFVQCEAVSLTRDVPTGLGWMIGPFVQEIPRESLEFTLRSTRDAVLSVPGVLPTAVRNHKSE